jgi:uncharacterized membrane protein
MEINPGGVIAVLLIVCAVATIACVALFILLNVLKVFRLGWSSIALFSIIGGILLTFIFFTADFSCNKGESDRITTEPAVR